MKKRCLDVVDCLLLLLRPVAREAEVVEDLNAGMLTAAAFFRKKRREFRAGHLLFLSFFEKKIPSRTDIRDQQFFCERPHVPQAERNRVRDRFGHKARFVLRPNKALIGSLTTDRAERVDP